MLYTPCWRTRRRLHFQFLAWDLHIHLPRSHLIRAQLCRLPVWSLIARCVVIAFQLLWWSRFSVDLQQYLRCSRHAFRV